MKPNDKQLQRIYEDVLSGVPARVASDPDVALPRRTIFRRVYKAPGYPTDPRNEAARALDSYVNAFSPQPAGVYDAAPLKRWLVDNIN